MHTAPAYFIFAFSSGYLRSLMKHYFIPMLDIYYSVINPGCIIFLIS